jgi:hypothetical protein
MEGAQRNLSPKFGSEMVWVALLYMGPIVYRDSGPEVAIYDSGCRQLGPTWFWVRGDHGAKRNWIAFDSHSSDFLNTSIWFVLHAVHRRQRVIPLRFIQTNVPTQVYFKISSDWDVLDACSELNAVICSQKIIHFGGFAESQRSADLREY